MRGQPTPGRKHEHTKSRLSAFLRVFRVRRGELLSLVERAPGSLGALDEFDLVAGLYVG